MSLCYDFEKWTMITLSIVAITLTVGLVLMQYAHGQANATERAIEQAKKVMERLVKFQESEELTSLKDIQKLREPAINYCFEHADRPNPIQDLIDKGFFPEGYKETCKSIKQQYDTTKLQIEEWEQKIDLCVEHFDNKT